MQEFYVNEYINLKLEGNRTNIYVNDEYISLCKHLLIAIPIDETEEWDKYKTMDEIIDYSHSHAGKRPKFTISPEEEFIGHCSNIQAWAENGYDCKLLDTTLAIPIITEILRGLVEKHVKRKTLNVAEDYYRRKFRTFIFTAIQSLDEYYKDSLEKEKERSNGYFEYHFKLIVNKFKFMRRIFSYKRNKFFEEEEIEGSFFLSLLHDNFKKNIKKNDNGKKYYWERKLFGKDLSYRRHLQHIRNAVDDHSRKLLAVSDRMDYLPYLYATGKFNNTKGRISFIEIGDYTIFRDENGNYWKRWNRY